MKVYKRNYHSSTPFKDCKALLQFSKWKDKTKQGVHKDLLFFFFGKLYHNSEYEEEIFMKNDDIQPSPHLVGGHQRSWGEQLKTLLYIV